VADVLQACGAADPDWDVAGLLRRRNAAGFTALQLAVDSNDVDAALVLLREMEAAAVPPHAPALPDPEAAPREEEAALRPLLHLAAARGDAAMAEALFAAATHCELDRWGRPPSAVAANAAVKALAVAWEEEHCTDVAVAPSEEYRACTTDSTGTCLLEAGWDDCDFTVVSSLTREEFERDFLVANKPVLVRGGVQSWPAVGKWSPGFLQQVYAGLPVRIGAIPYAGLYGEPSRQASMAEYGRYSTLVESDEASQLMGDDAPVLYVFDNELFESDQAPQGMRGDFSPPALIEGRHTHPVQFMWGPQGSGAPVHYHQNAVNGVVLGEKHWLLYPPAKNFVSKEPAGRWFEAHGDDDRALRCVQRKGDLVFVPDSWGHAVLNTKETVALAFEFVFP